MNHKLQQQQENQVNWYCVQTRPKSEHVAVAGLRRFGEVETYCPRIRYQKVTSRGKVWFNEALFPNYVFAKFVIHDSLRAVRSSQAVVRVVGFGDFLGEVPEGVIDGIRAEMGGNPVREVAIPVCEGEEVEVAQGPFCGIKGIVTGLLSGNERVRILMRMLGQENLVDVPIANLKRRVVPREALVGSSVPSN